ncbi:MAG: sulfite exporter TauE/SafE family protein [Lachnospiraceae bacterium]
MLAVFFIISFSASVLGAICGIGGGIIIKPILDATGLLGVSEISFLAGSTVLGMSIISVSKQIKRNEKLIDRNTGLPIAVGAALGGLGGKELFQYAYVLCPNQNTVGMIQASILLILTVGTFLYMWYQSKIKTHNIQHRAIIFAVGFSLGVLSAFLGIGGGPFNLIALAFFFSMGTKQAVANSLYIILFSQATSIISTVVQARIPKVSPFFLITMICGGIIGGMVGSTINHKISGEKVNKLFMVLLVAIIGICVYNIIRYSA